MDARLYRIFLVNKFCLSAFYKTGQNTFTSVSIFLFKLSPVPALAKAKFSFDFDYSTTHTHTPPQLQKDFFIPYPDFQLKKVRIMFFWVCHNMMHKMEQFFPCMNRQCCSCFMPNLSGLQGDPTELI